MKQLIDPTDNPVVLEKWRGADAKIWILDVSLNRLVIRLFRYAEPEVLYILGASCQHITGPFHWKNSNIVIIEDPDNSSGEHISRIIDDNAGFELRCTGGIILAKGPATDFDKTLDNFLSEPPIVENW